MDILTHLDSTDNDGDMMSELALIENMTGESAIVGWNLYTLGQVANQAAGSSVFADYRERKAKNTIRRQDADLDLFASFLRSTGAEVGDLARFPEAWENITWGLVVAFMRWQLAEGYAVPSVNVRLSTIKMYAKLALKAGALDPAQYALIRAVEGYSHKEVKRVDDKRQAAEIPTRKGAKKAAAVSLTNTQATALKSFPDTPQGRRDTLMMCLMLDHGLRVGEVAILKVTDFDLMMGELRFYRPKVNIEQTHRLTDDTLKAAKRYFEHDAPASGLLLRCSRKDGSLDQSGMSERAITARVRVLGSKIGVEGLSAHDLRHSWATRAARNGTPVNRLQDAGGWSSPAMPLHYIEVAKVANLGVKL